MRQQGKSRLVAMAAAHYGKFKNILVVSSDPKRMREAIAREGGGAFPIRCKVASPDSGAEK